MPQTRWLKQTPIFPQLWRLEVQDQDAGRVGFFWDQSSWLVDSHLLPMSSHGVLVCLSCQNKIPQTRLFKPQKLIFLTVLEIGKSTIKVLANSFPIEGRQPPSWLLDDCLLTVSSQGRETENRLVVLPVSDKSPSPIYQIEAPTLVRSCNHYHLLTDGSKYSHIGGWGFNVGIWEGWGNRDT